RRHGLRAGAGQRGADLQGREFHVGQGRDWQVEVGGDADQADGQREERGRDRAVDEGTRQAHGAGLALGSSWARRTSEPFFSVIWPSVTTSSPAFTPLLSTAASASVAVRTTGAPGPMTKPNRPFGPRLTAVAGTMIAFGRVCSVSFTLTNSPGQSLRAGLGNSAFSWTVPVAASTRLSALVSWP